MGTSPSDHLNHSSKMNVFLVGLLIISLIIQIFVNVKQKLYKDNQLRSIRENDNSQLDLATFLFTSFFISTVFVFFSTAIVINVYTFQDLTQYPKYLLLYLLHFFTVPTVNILFICFLFKNDKKMQRYVKNEFGEKILFLGRKLNLVDDPVFVVSS